MKSISATTKAAQEGSLLPREVSSSIKYEVSEDRFLLSDTLVYPVNPDPVFGIKSITLVAQALSLPHLNRRSHPTLIARVSSFSHDVDLEHAEEFLDILSHAFARARELKEDLRKRVAEAVSANEAINPSIPDV